MIEYKISLITKFLTGVYGGERKVRESEEAQVFVAKTLEDFEKGKKKIDNMVS